MPRLLTDLPEPPYTLWEEGENCHNMDIETATTENELHWYALKVYFHRQAALIADLTEHGTEYFSPAKVIPSLLFVRCSLEYIKQFAAEHWQQSRVYREPGSRKPSAIPDREMEVFRFVVTAGEQGLTLLGDDRPEYHQGDRVRVTDGPFKGAEGHIKRIKKDRRVVVAIGGVVAVAITYIHPKFLEKVAEEETPTLLNAIR